MPQKHAKNNCASKVFNHWERSEAATDGKYGTVKVRLGGDSHLTFGHCALCIHPAMDPMASPSGHVYCKECIVEYLLVKTQELKRQREAFEVQQKAKVIDAANGDKTRRAEAESAFVSTQLVVASPSVADGTSNKEGKGKKRSREELSGGGEVSADEGSRTDRSISKKDLGGSDAAVEKELTRRAVLQTRAEKVEELRTTSWWLPQFQPEAPEDQVQAPPKRPSSPMSGEPLRPKDLMPVTFTIDCEKQKTAHISGGDANKGTIICPVTRKGLTTQKIVLIKKSGQVMLEDAYKQFALPTMTCPITEQKFKAKDVIPLVTSGSSFAASGQVEVTKYAPALR